MKISKAVIFYAGSCDMWVKNNIYVEFLGQRALYQAFTWLRLFTKLRAVHPERIFTWTKLMLPLMLRTTCEDCHLWLRRDLERTTISTNWNCIWICCLLVGRWTLEVIGRNYLPAVIPWRAALLHAAHHKQNECLPGSAMPELSMQHRCWDSVHVTQWVGYL